MMMNSVISTDDFSFRRYGAVCLLFFSLTRHIVVVFLLLQWQVHYYYGSVVCRSIRHLVWRKQYCSRYIRWKCAIRMAVSVHSAHGVYSSKTKKQNKRMKKQILSATFPACLDTVFAIGYELYNWQHLFCV